MGLAPVEITMELVDGKVKLRGISKTRPDTPVIFDYLPPLGTGDGFVGIEMMVMSFAGCVSTAIIGFLKRRGKALRSYEMTIRGIKHEDPLFLEAIEFTAVLGAENVTQDELADVLAIAEKISPAWIAIRGNVKVTGEIRIEGGIS
jgi:putative redox protein